MREHVKADERFERTEISVADAHRALRAEGQDYKVELIEDLITNEGVDTVSLYTNGAFTDLCRGPHGPEHQAHQGLQADFDRRRLLARRLRAGRCSPASTARPSSPRRTSRSTWSGSRRRAPATTASSAASSGCSCSRTSRPASPFWQPAGHPRLERAHRPLAHRERRRAATREVRTPILYDVELWKQSGHWDKYRDNMYFTDVEGRPMGLKPMNCPAHIQIYKDEPRSYRDLPIRYAEQGLVHRHEPSGTLHGLLRVRSHHPGRRATSSAPRTRSRTRCCAASTSASTSTTLFGFEPRLELSTRPDNRIGSDEMWDRRRGRAGGRARSAAGSTTR